VLSLHEFKAVLRVVEWDLMKPKRQKAFMAMRTAWFIIQTLVFGYTISKITRPDIGVDHYTFYLLGLYTALLYSASIARAYIIADEFDDGIIDYHLSLPLKRSVLAAGRVIGGAVSTIIFTVPMMVFILYLAGGLEPISLLTSIASAFAFSTGVVSLVVIIVMKHKSTDTTDILFGTIDAILVRLSSVFYPLPINKALNLPLHILVQHWEIGVELRREVTQYLLTLPVRRESLIIGGLFGGVARGLIYQFGFLVFASIILAPPSPEGWAHVLATSFTLALTMWSVSISLSTVTRDFNMQATIRSLTYYLLFFVSNIFYPQRVVAARLGPLAPIFDYSPLTMATSIYRWAFKYDVSLNPLSNLIGLLVWGLIIVVVAYKLYLRNLLRD